MLPFLQGEAITARVDLKADRQAGVLLVQAAHLEPEAGGAVDHLALAPTPELASMAKWLGLERVEVMRDGAFERSLQRYLPL